MGAQWNFFRALSLRGLAPRTTHSSGEAAHAQREAELTQLNGKLYTIAKVQSDKSCRLWRMPRRPAVVR